MSLTEEAVSFKVGNQRRPFERLFPDHPGECLYLPWGLRAGECRGGVTVCAVHSGREFHIVDMSDFPGWICCLCAGRGREGGRDGS